MMKFLLLLLLPLNIYAQTRIVDGDIFTGISHRKNYIKNGEIEKNKNDITDSSSIASRSTSSPLSGSASLLIDGTANAQKVIFTAYAREPQLYGQTCQASFIYNGDASLYTASVEQGGSTVSGTSTTLTNAGTSAATYTINFACGVAATGANTVVLTCTSASCAAIKVDKVFLGLAPVTLTSALTCSVRAVSTTDTATTSDCQIHGSGTYTETLYTPSDGNEICVKNAGTGTITLNGGGNIDGETSQVLDPGVSLCLYGYSSNWYIK